VQRRARAEIDADDAHTWVEALLARGAPPDLRERLQQYQLLQTDGNQRFYRRHPEGAQGRSQRVRADRHEIRELHQE
jgi:uncharacterized protein involved in exopolysaccharide biosynthesis